jgi:hypothetical protein
LEPAGGNDFPQPPSTGYVQFQSKHTLEQINFEKVYLLCKDLSANPCHEMLVGELGLPLSKHFKVKML